MPKKSENKINLELAEIFWEIADILEFKKTRWKPQAYRMAAQTIESLRYPITQIYKQEGEKGIDKLPGIGEGITKKIIEYIKNKKIKEYEKLKKSLPGEIYQIMQIPGIGPKKAALFYNKKGIKSVKQLKQLAKQHKLIGLPGFKTKAEQKILEGIELEKSKKPRIPYKEALNISNLIIKDIKNIPEVKQVIATGSIRRKKPSIGDIDIVIKTNNPEKVLNKFVKSKNVLKVLGKGKKKAIVILKQGFQCDVRAALPKEFGATVLYFTGDKQHDIWLRKKAIKLGYKLNEYGLFDKKGKKIAGKTEKEIYNKLKLKMYPPEKRIGETE